MKEMFRGAVNSPETTITNNISNSDTIIYVLDDTKIPEEIPNIMVLGTTQSSETVKVIEADGNKLTVERGFQGIARAWNSGTIIARNFTEYDYEAMRLNIEKTTRIEDKKDDTKYNYFLQISASGKPQLIYEEV